MDRTNTHIAEIQKSTTAPTQNSSMESTRRSLKQLIRPKGKYIITDSKYVDFDT